MLSWSFTFFVLALASAFFGFSGVAAASAGIAKILFFLFLLMFLASFFFQATRSLDRAVDEDLF